METTKNLGIWMDHANAKLIDFNTERINSSVKSKFSYSTKEAAINKSENLMHNKEQQMHEAYYKEFGENILHYDHVLLFGPTNAKTELNNYLDKDAHYRDIKIDVESADKMSDDEKYAFVKNHFSK